MPIVPHETFEHKAAPDLDDGKDAEPFYERLGLGLGYGFELLGPHAQKELERKYHKIGCIASEAEYQLNTKSEPIMLIEAWKKPSGYTYPPTVTKKFEERSKSGQKSEKS